GLYVRPGPVITVTQTSISGNSFSGLGGYGGGIYLLCGYMTIRESTIEGNTATTGSTSYGGGIDAGGTLTLTNSTVSANQANQGGGINFSSCGAVVLTNSTIANNTATSGGGIQDQQYYGGSLTLKNSVVADNSGGNCVNFGEVHSAGYNLDSGNTCGFTNPGDLINTDPLLGPLQDNGGPTWTHALLEGSPAVDAADNVGCPTIDQRGISRPQDGDGDGSAVCDIGAFEHPPTAHQLHLPAVMNQATRPGAGPRWR
ncbi:MAG: right-handed parallel beta-helix repeat-containing protein, partial [Chloroflexota bacterium]